MPTPVSEEEKLLLMNIGCALLVCQMLERPLDMFCELASASVLTLDLLESLDAEDRRKTVGQMLKTLRESVEVDPQIDSPLQSFLEHRNEFVHRLENGNRGMGTPQSRKVLAQFLSTLFHELDWLMAALPGLLLAWSRAAGLEEQFMGTFGTLPADFIAMVERYEFRPKAGGLGPDSSTRQ